MSATLIRVIRLTRRNKRDFPMIDRRATPSERAHLSSLEATR